jgi:hypothetical protein
MQRQLAASPATVRLSRASSPSVRRAKASASFSPAASCRLARETIAAHRRALGLPDCSALPF